jgi:hypothetical protein
MVCVLPCDACALRYAYEGSGFEGTIFRNRVHHRMYWRSTLIRKRHECGIAADVVIS